MCNFLDEKFSKWFRLFNSQWSHFWYPLYYKYSQILARPFTSERSEPSSRNFLIGEQPNPWKLLHLQDKLSRHRGAELRRRYERLGATSLLSLE